MRKSMVHFAVLSGLMALVTGPMVAPAEAQTAGHEFTVRVENVSIDTTLKPSNGTKAPAAVAPVLYVIHTTSAPLFTSGRPDRRQGLEQLAEEGNPAPLAESLRIGAGVVEVGFINTPVGATGPGPIGPGGVYELSFSPPPGSRLPERPIEGGETFCRCGPKPGPGWQKYRLLHGCPPAG